MILYHRIDAVGISRSTVYIMSVAVEILQSHHAIAEWYIEGIGSYVLAILIGIFSHGRLVVQTALAIRSRYEEIRVEIVLDASYQSHGSRSH